MPLTPQQARAARTKMSASAAADLLIKIDAYLGSQRQTISGEWFFSIEGCAPDVIDVVIMIYQEAGWNVRRHSDRDGVALVFSERRP